MRPATATPSPLRHRAQVFEPRSAHAGNPPACDPEIARLFSELRSFLALSVPAAAGRLGTHPGVIAALETGRLDLLPPWSETARVVSAYILLAHLEPRPALDRLARQMGVVRTANAPVPQVAYNARLHAHSQVAREEAATPVARILGRLSQAAIRAQERARSPSLLSEWAHHLRETAHGLAATMRGARAPVRWVVVGALGLIILGSAAPSAVLQASVTGISQPISGLWRSLNGQAAEVRVRLREGLKWIEVDDPRQRRSDKLPSRRT